MRREFIGCMLAGLLSLSQVGCEPKPVVVEPGDGGTTVIEESETVVEEPAKDSDADADVNVKVGGGEGVNVDVDKDANP